MIDYSKTFEEVINNVKNPPELNIFEFADGALNLNFEFGKLLLNEKEYKIKDIKITIKNQIDVVFNTRDEYHRDVTYEGLINGMFTKLKEFEHIEIYVDDYKIELTNTFLKNREINSIKTKSMMRTSFNHILSVQKLLIKNNNEINADDIVDMWYITEKINLGEQPSFFTLADIDKLLYKKYLHGKYENSSGYFYVQDLYSSSVRWDKKMENIFHLSKLYDCNIINFPVKIIKNGKYEELEFYSRGNFNNNAKSIFDQDRDRNYFEFINSSFMNFGKCNHGEETTKIKLLIDYYVGYKNERSIERKTLIAEVFMEIFKEQYLFSTQKKLEEKLIHSFDKLNLDSDKIRSILLNKVNEKFNIIENQLVSQLPPKRSEILDILGEIRKNYLFKHIAWYRNKNAHEGNINSWNNGIWEDIIKRLFNDVTGGVLGSDSNKSPEKEIYDLLESEFRSFYDFVTLSKFREKVMEFYNCLLPLILLRILDIDCKLYLDIPVNDPKNVERFLKDDLNLNYANIQIKDLGRYNNEISILYNFFNADKRDFPNINLPEEWQSDISFNTKNNLKHFLKN